MYHGHESNREDTPIIYRHSSILHGPKASRGSTVIKLANIHVYMYGRMASMTLYSCMYIDSTLAMIDGTIFQNTCSNEISRYGFRPPGLQNMF